MCTVAPHAGGFRHRFVTFTSVTCEIIKKTLVIKDLLGFLQGDGLIQSVWLLNLLYLTFLFFSSVHKSV